MAKKILIVEDEIELIDMLRIRLEANGYQVITAFDGQQGLERAKSEKPDLIIMDIMMPKKDGWTFVREMKTDDSIKRIPVIMLTAKEGMEDMFKLEGVKGYVTKPFEAEELLLRVKLCIGE